MDAKTPLAQAPFTIGLCALLLALASCSGGQTGGPASAPDAGTSIAEATTAPGDATTAATALALMATVDQHGIEIARQAQTKSMTDRAATFAAALLDDHDRHLEAIRALEQTTATAGAVDEARLAPLREQHAADLERLARLQGEAYQRAWVDVVVTTHTAVLEMLDTELIPTVDGDLHGHLEQAGRTMARHLETAQRLRDTRR